MMYEGVYYFELLYDKIMFNNKIKKLNKIL